jgi:hypothetical protein
VKRIDEHDDANERQTGRDRPAAEAFDEPRLRSAPEADIRDPARQCTEFVFGYA